MYSFNIILTNLCNAHCSHCYMKTNENPKTLSSNQIDLLVDKLPINTKTIVITGGEIFSAISALEYFLNRINNKFNKIQIGLESYGIYLYTHDALKILKRLKELNVDFIRFSDDPFHEIGGVNLDKVRKLKGLESNDTPKIKYLVQIKALSIGKAEQLKNEEKSKPCCMNTSDSRKNPYLFMDITGDMYLCAWKSGKKVGNIFTDNFFKIEENLKERVNSCILTGNIVDAISTYTNENKENIKNSIDMIGECNTCINTFIKRKKFI